MKSPRERRGTAIVAGSLAQKPFRGGHTWVLLQYLLGLRRLGFDVLFLDWLEPDMCVDRHGRRCSPEDSVNVAYLLDVMNEFGFGASFSLLGRGAQPTMGCSWPHVLQCIRRSAFVLNVMGFLQDECLLGEAQKRVFLDIDPGFGQMWRDLGLNDSFRGHDAYVTIGENIGEPDCTIPTCGLSWTTTRQPVVLDEWPVSATNGQAFTTVAAWRGAYGPVDYRGETYGLRVHEFRRFVDLPRRCPIAFEAAVSIDESEVDDLALLRENGWRVVDPLTVASDPCAYQSYIQASKAELMIAKGMYVKSRSGWFSDRSICYLASGKPVVAQDTGIGHLYPAGNGLLLFTTADEAAAAVDEVCNNYEHHSQAARRLAKEYFDSDRVLTRLLTQLDL